MLVLSFPFRKSLCYLWGRVFVSQLTESRKYVVLFPKVIIDLIKLKN